MLGVLCNLRSPISIVKDFRGQSLRGRGGDRSSALRDYEPFPILRAGLDGHGRQNQREMVRGNHLYRLPVFCPQNAWLIGQIGKERQMIGHSGNSFWNSTISLVKQEVMKPEGNPQDGWWGRIGCGAGAEWPKHMASADLDCN